MTKQKMHVKKGDNVVVLAGKDRGKNGKVLQALPQKDRVVVENVNVIKRHSRPRPGQEGGIFEREAAIHASNVKLVCPACGEDTRTGVRLLDDGLKARYCKKCNEIVDK